MLKLDNVLILPDTKIKETMEIIDKNSLQIAVVVDENNRLLGTVTDGDIRRGILNGVSIKEKVTKIMNVTPIATNEDVTKDEIIKILSENKLHHLPILDKEGRVKRIEFLDKLLKYQKRENWIILMVGGLGRRLRPLTENCPKPMLRIKNKPLLEIVIKHFMTQGFYKFCLCINYKGNCIKNYFKDGSQLGIKIKYICEQKAMGTAGSLSMFNEKIHEPVIVMNGDILTKVNFNLLIDFHLENKGDATIAVHNYDFQIPYGEVKVNNGKLIGFEEKPVYTSYVNAGIYVLNPYLLKKIPDSYFDMNQLFKVMLESNQIITVFPIREYWIDIGSIKDFNKAKLDYDEVFE
ncbi:nucleotidyltransferase family protein [Clostridiaceae bacterium M8S5]|nr:nucleotidyltransferase family protein [Clostridiaceae bacterium M8S5]